MKNGITYFESVSPAYEAKEDTREKSLVVSIKVRKSEWDKFDPNQVDLQVSSSEVKVSSNGMTLSVSTPTDPNRKGKGPVGHELNSSKASASYKKKKGLLVVKVVYK